MFVVRRRYLAALALAAILAVVLVVIPKISSTIHNHDAHDALVAADAAFKHLKVPADFETIPRRDRTLVVNLGCSSFPCYRVRRPEQSVRLQLPAVLRSAGAQSDNSQTDCPAGSRPGLGYCSIQGITHGYRVLIVAFPILRPSTHAVRPIGTLVQIHPPFITEDSNSGWPVKP